MAWPDMIPYIRYEDPRAMLDWLADAFGFERHAGYEDDGEIVHAEVAFGTGMFMVGPTRGDDPTSAKTPSALAHSSTLLAVAVSRLAQGLATIQPPAKVASDHAH